TVVILIVSGSQAIAAAAVEDVLYQRLSTVKPLLDNPKHPKWSNLVKDLQHIASLAENFTEQRPKFSKNVWGHLIDALDQEGWSHLWSNRLIRKTPGDNGNAHIAAPVIRVLNLASHTGIALCDADNTVLAASVLSSAARFEDHLKSASDSESSHNQAIASATVMYYSSRMEAAWKEGNYAVAEYMSRKITGKRHTTSGSASPSRLQKQRELLAFKFHQIGRSLLQASSSSQDGAKPEDAVQWVQRAFSLADQLQESAPAVAELRISILRTLGKDFRISIQMLSSIDVIASMLTARAHFLSESYDRAESVLDELLPLLECNEDRESSDYQQLRWLRLTVLKRRKSGDLALLEAFKSIIGHMVFSEANITEYDFSRFWIWVLCRQSVFLPRLLQDLKSLNQHHTLVTAVHHHCLDEALRRQTTEPDHIHRLILSSIIHASKDEDHQRAMKALDSVFTQSQIVQLLWQYGGRHYKAKRWNEAADWYLAGSHKLFKANSQVSEVKCFRKAALCYLEQREFMLASTVIRRCPVNEAPTHYVMFLVAVYQGLEDEAVRAIHDMLRAPDFDRKMLLLATQISHKSEMKTLLLTVLQSLLKTLRTGSEGEDIVQAMTLIRCIVKLVLNILAEPAANKSALIDTVVNQFKTAQVLADSASKQKTLSLVFKDLSWLWRTAYNCAVQGCSEWENAGEQISELFSIAGAMAEACCNASPVETDAFVCLHLANAWFAAASGRVFSARELLAANGSIDDERLRNVTAELKAAKSKIADICNKNVIQDDQAKERVQYFLHALKVFEAEFLVQLREWDSLATLVEDVVTSGPLAVGTYEAIADILWVDKTCPVKVLQKCLEAVLQASTDHRSLCVEKFSRWLRAICTISITRNSVPDRLKAFGYFEQAVNVMQDHNNSEEPYPLDERQWLLATACNAGTECLHASLLDEGKRWFEIAITICRFVPGGKAEKSGAIWQCSLGEPGYQKHIDSYYLAMAPGSDPEPCGRSPWSILSRFVDNPSHWIPVHWTLGWTCDLYDRHQHSSLMFLNAATMRGPSSLMNLSDLR
ncbi:hypothetical protein CVT24_011819, partial [Panaeolus cyanescens]